LLVLFSIARSVSFGLLEGARSSPSGRKETILADHIKPAAARAGIAGKVGWHNLRHTYSSLLRVLGSDVKVQQELLRHAGVSTTLNIYTQAISEQKREAASKIARLLLPPQNAEGPSHRPLVVPSCTRLM